MSEGWKLLESWKDGPPRVVPTQFNYQAKLRTGIMTMNTVFYSWIMDIIVTLEGSSSFTNQPRLQPLSISLSVYTCVNVRGAKRMA